MSLFDDDLGVGFVPIAVAATAGAVGAAALIVRWATSKTTITLTPAPDDGPICITIPVSGGYDKLVPRSLGSGATRAADELYGSVLVRSTCCVLFH
jgi:hypothetical protein